nr:hypothetical protein [Tanacetum cinerariifolium]
MANLTFADTHNMVAYLSKSEASTGFDQIVDFLNDQVIQYALMVNSTIYVSCIKQFWATTLIKKEHITSPPQAPSITPPPTPPQAQPAPSSSPPQEQPKITSTSDMTLLSTLLETCTTLSNKVAALEQDKVAQALEILKLERRVKKLEKQRRSIRRGAINRRFSASHRVRIRWTPYAASSPPSPDYIPGLEEPQTPPVPQDEDEHETMFIQPHDPDFMPEPIYPEYIPLEDEHILSVEEQPLPPVVSPTAESPEYVVESDLEEDLKEYEDDETKDGPVDYPIDGGDDDDDASSGDDADDEDEDEEDEEEEEHLAPTDSAVVIPTDELVSPPEGTEPVMPPPSIDTATTGARITFRL